MIRILHSILVLAIMLAYGVGGQTSLEFEHTHDLAADHGHEHSLAAHGSDHHSHDHGSVPPSDPSPDGEPVNESHHHSHVVVLGTDLPIHAPDFPKIGGTAWTSGFFPMVAPDICPDGPCFSLIKPPQLG